MNAVRLCARSIAAAALLAPLSGAAGADPPPATGPATQPATAPAADAELAALFKRLDDTSYQVREAAQEELLSRLIAEPPIEPVVQGAALAHPSPEVRTRAARALAALAEHELFGATLVSLSVEEVTPSQLLAEFAEAAGIEVKQFPEPSPDVPMAPDGEKPVSLTLEEVPFWEAVATIGEATGLHLMEHGPHGGDALVFSQHAASFGRLPSSEAGAFLVQVSRIYRSDSATVVPEVGDDGRIIGKGNASRNLMVELRILVEPKVRLGGGIGQPEVTVAVDEQGRDLRPPQTQNHGRTWHGGNRSFVYQVQAQLDPQQAVDATRLARFEGEFESEIVRETAVLDIPMDEITGEAPLESGRSIRTDEQREVGPFVVKILSVTRGADGQMKFELALEMAGGLQPGDQRWQQVHQSLAALQLLDADGTPWQHAGDSTRWDGQELRVERSFMPAPDRRPGPVGNNARAAGADRPARLHWEVPVRTDVIPISFKFEDLPLPLINEQAG